MLRRIAYLLFIVLLISACFNLNRISLYNLSSLYNTARFTELTARIYNTDDNNARVFIPVIRSDMAILLDTVAGRPYTSYSISGELFRTYESKDILDSSRVIITDSTVRISDTLIFLDIEYPGREEYVLKLELTDLNRVDVVKAFYFIDNTSSRSRNHYLVFNEDGEILFKQEIASDEQIRIEFANKETTRLFVRYYHREFPLALPPFMEESNTSFDFKADSIFSIELIGGSAGIKEFADEGIYHFQQDTMYRDGFSLFRFYDGFPEIVTTGQMLAPLRYITTKREYNELMQAEDMKLAVDNFWIEVAGNPSRARAMIQKYYGRVEDANKYFSSYHEGWKTDRGLIFIVYGPPKIIYRGNGIEEWLYGEKGHSNSIRFQFVRVENPFTDNDYGLIKSPSYKEKWYNIVNTWRR